MLSSLWSLSDHAASLTLGISLLTSLYITLRHLTRDRGLSYPYLGYPLLPHTAPSPTRRGLKLAEPRLLMYRQIIIWGVTSLLLSFVWSQSTSGTLVIADGSFEVNDSWPRPIYVVSAHAPYKSASSLELDTSVSSSSHVDLDWSWTSEDPRPISVTQRAIFLPRRVGAYDPQGAQRWAERTLRFKSVVRPPSLPALITQARASWRAPSATDANDQLVVTAFLDDLSGAMERVQRRANAESRQERHLSIDVDQLVIEGGPQGEHHRSSWQMIGTLEPVKGEAPSDGVPSSGPATQRAQLWRAYLPRAELKGSMLRLSPRLGEREGERGQLIEWPSVLCVPQRDLVYLKDERAHSRSGLRDMTLKRQREDRTQSDDEAELSALKSLLSIHSRRLNPRDEGSGGRVSPDIVRAHDVDLFETPVQVKSSPALAQSGSPVHLTGDPWAEFELSSPRPRSSLDPWGHERVWAPRTSGDVIGSQRAIYPVNFRVIASHLRETRSLHGIASPPWPSPTLTTSRARASSGNHPLLWGVQRRLSSMDPQTPPRGVAEPSTLWQSQTSLIDLEVMQNGQLNYTWGLSPQELKNQSPLWSKLFAGALRQEVLMTTSRCLNWTVGEVARVSLGTNTREALMDARLYTLPLVNKPPVERSTPKPLSHGVSMALDQEGPFALYLSNTTTQSSTLSHRQAPLLINRHIPKSDPVSVMTSSDVRPTAVSDLSSSFSDSILRAWRVHFKWTMILVGIIMLGVYMWSRVRISSVRLLSVWLVVMIVIMVIGWIRLQSRELMVGLIGSESSLMAGQLNSNTALSAPLPSQSDFTSHPRIQSALLKLAQRHRITFMTPRSASSVNDSPLLVSPSATPLSPMMQSLIYDHSGPIWINSWEASPPPSVTLRSAKIDHDHDQQKVHVTALLDTPFNAEASVYLGDQRRELKLTAPQTLLGGWIDGAEDLSAIRLRVEPEYAPGLTYRGLNQIIPVDPPQRSRAWAWGRDASTLLRSVGVQVMRPPPDALRTAPPSALGMIALHGVVPTALTREQREALLAWVREGGRLFWMGHLLPEQRRDQARAWDQGAWSTLMPLHLDAPIHPQRQAQVVLIVDRSGSTAESAGGPGLAAITAQLSELTAALAPRDEVTLISFGGGVSLNVPPTERRALSAFPVPTQSRGSTLIRPALELALTYRRPDLPAHWVIITDGVWGDEPSELAELQERIKASGAHVTVALTGYSSQREARGVPKDQALECVGACALFSKSSEVSLERWRDLSINNLRDPLAPQRSEAGVVESGPRWSGRVGGELPQVERYTPMGIDPNVSVLAEVEGYPLLVEHKVGQGVVIQLMTDRWTLSSAQWSRLLGVGARQAHRWSVNTQTVWDSERGYALQVHARGIDHWLDSPAELHDDQAVTSLRWISSWPGESVLNLCNERGCQPAALPLNQAKVSTLITPLRQDPQPTRLALLPQSPTLTLMGSRAKALTRSLALNAPSTMIAGQPKLVGNTSRSSRPTTPEETQGEASVSYQILAHEQRLARELETWALRQRTLAPETLVIIVLYALLALILIEVVLWDPRAGRRDELPRA